MFYVTFHYYGFIIKIKIRFMLLNTDRCISTLHKYLFTFSNFNLFCYMYKEICINFFYQFYGLQCLLYFLHSVCSYLICRLIRKGKRPFLATLKVVGNIPCGFDIDSHFVVKFVFIIMCASS